MIRGRINWFQHFEGASGLTCAPTSMQGCVQQLLSVLVSAFLSRRTNETRILRPHKYLKVSRTTCWSTSLIVTLLTTMERPHPNDTTYCVIVSVARRNVQKGEMSSVKLKVGDTEGPLQVCQLSRSSESTHFRSFVEMLLYSFPPEPGIASEIGGTCLRSNY